MEYRWGWLGAQVARHRDHFSANLYASIPLSEREFIPKIAEPAPYRPANPPPRVSGAEWQQDQVHAARLVAALGRQDFKNIRVAYEGGTLRLVLSNSRIAEMGRGGPAVRPARRWCLRRAMCAPSTSLIPGLSSRWRLTNSTVSTR
ncbi:hypothetical protein LP419_28600 [Massilia sp. H-1]|nr:hypothetical protein LP419_28600 [Massilia sp. H-1]